MLPLSELLRYPVRPPGRAQRPLRLADLGVTNLDVDYPPVAYYFVHAAPAEAPQAWPSEAVRVDPGRRAIALDPQAGPVDGALDDGARPVVRVARDVLDGLIVDLRARRVTHTNDVWLATEPAGLRLHAAETGGQAIVRRLSRGRLRARQPGVLCDWKYVEFLRGSPEAVRAGERYHGRIIHLPPGEIAGLAEALPYLHAAELLELLPEQLAADTLELLPPARQLQVFEELVTERGLALLARMAPDVAADLIGRLETEAARRLLNRLPLPHAERIVALLRYPPDTVGGMMTNDMVMVPAGQTVRQAWPVVRAQIERPDFVYFLYVVDDLQSRRLRGVLSLRDWVSAEPDTRIDALMNPYLITLRPHDSPREAAYHLLRSQLAALPVVDGDGRLLGTVTVDVAVAQVAPRAWRAQAPRVFS